MNYFYFEKGSFYFRKRINHGYLKDKPNGMIFRISIKKIAKPFYVILENNTQELNNFTTYLNKRLDILLRHKKGELMVEDIMSYIYNICEEYKKTAIIENSSLEMKRIEALSYVNENGIQNGYSIQAISKKYKQIVDQYDNLDDKEKTYELGNEILKRSNITREQLLEVKPSEMIIFHEMLIKAEKAVLENDIKLYISRNYAQFNSLVLNPTESLESQINQAYYEYLDLVRLNPIQVDYLKFIRDKKFTPVATKVEETLNIEDILKLVREQTFTEKENVQVDIELLILKFLEFRKYKDKKYKEVYRALQYFKSFCFCKNKKIEELTSDDFIELEDLLINLPPKNKAEEWKDLSIYELVNKRKRENLARVTTNTVVGFGGAIKAFWTYLCKNHKNLKLDIDFKDLLVCKNSSQILKDIEDDNDPLLRSFKTEEINKFIEVAYSNKELKRTLLNSPRNFYLFVLSYLCGLRQEEALLLSMKDIKVQTKGDKKYYYLYLNENEKFQHLKNENAHRNIPITDLMIDLGFLNYVEIRHKKGAETLFDFPKSVGSAARAFFSRKFVNLFPNQADTRENRNNRILDNYIQFRSFRKNFAELLFSETRNSYDTIENKKRIMSHDNQITGVYLGRAEPFQIYHILNDIDYSHINFEPLKVNIKDYFKTIKTDLKWLKEEVEEWKIKSKVRPKRGKKI